MWAFVLSALIDSARTVIIPLLKKDKKLYEKYGLSSDEIEFIEAMIRPMAVSKPNFLPM